mgnify:CR=1 FL=1
MISSNISLKLFTCSIILLILHSMNAWFLWDVDIAIFETMALFFGLIYKNSVVSKKQFKKKSLLIIALLLIITTIYKSSYGLHFIFELKISLLVLLFVNYKAWKYILDKWTKVFAFILLVSLIAWGISFTGILPSFGIISPSSLGDTDYLYINYGLCLISLNTIGDIFRFTSVFLEPGHVAMIAVFTIIANNYNFRNKSVFIILIALLFTLSLAGYVLLFFGYLIKLFNSGVLTFFLKKFVPYIIFTVVLFSFSTYYNNGDNILNNYIFSRLEYDEDKGISGNNRTTVFLDLQFEKFVDSDEFLLGMNPTDYKILRENKFWTGAGYKVYLFEKGVVGTVLVFLLYFSFLGIVDDKRYAFGVLIIYVLCFIQRAYPLWNAWIYLYVLTLLNSLKYNNKKI